MKNSILFLFPPTELQIKGSVRGRGSRRSRAIAPPLGPLYLARVLLDAGYNVQFHDFAATDYSKEILSRRLQGIDLVGVTMQSFNRGSVQQLLRDIKEVNPSLPTVVGGPDCILHRAPVPNSDYTVIGEAEHTIVAIVDAILNGGDPSHCEGLVYVRNGRIGRGPEPTFRKDLDSIKFPARNIVDFQAYDVVGKKVNPKLATMITSRGCPFRCTFCARPSLQRQYRERSVPNVLKEIESLCEAGFQGLAFIDDEFLFRKERIKSIMRGIIERDLRLRMLVQGRVDSVDEELFGLMQEAGVKIIVFGLESGNQETLDFFRKRTTVEQNRMAVEMADKYNMLCFGFFIVGAPMETEKHVQDTIDFAMSLPLDGTTFNILDYTYGSELWNRAYEQGQIGKEEFNVPAERGRGLGHFAERELDRICSDAFDRFYKRPSLWARWARKTIRQRDLWMMRIMAGTGRWIARDLLG